MSQPTGPTSHSIVGPSKMEQRLGCPGSAAAERGRPDRSSAAADDGTRWHEAAAKALLSGVNAEDLQDLEDDPPGVEVVQPYLDYVREQHQRLGGRLVIEHRIDLTNLHPELTGTCDAAIIAPPVVAVVDFKTGYHPVEVRRPDLRPNLQLASYGLGATKLAAPDRVTSLELHVVQPKAGGSSSTVLDEDEILDIAGDILGIVEGALQPNAPRIAGEWCRWCLAKPDCPALRSHALAVAKAEFSDGVVDAATLPLPREMPPEDIANVLRLADMVDLWVSAVRQYAYGEAEKGRAIPGYKLVRRQQRVVWSKDASVEQLSRLFVTNLKLLPDDVFQKRKALSPKRVADALKQSGQPPIAPEVWAKLTQVRDAGLALVPEGDRRPAVQVVAGAEFEEVQPDDPFA